MLTGEWAGGRLMGAALSGRNLIPVRGLWRIERPHSAYRRVGASRISPTGEGVVGRNPTSTAARLQRLEQLIEAQVLRPVHVTVNIQQGNVQATQGDADADETTSSTPEPVGFRVSVDDDDEED